MIHNGFLFVFAIFNIPRYKRLFLAIFCKKRPLVFATIY
ncbi:hypothetical protein X875_11340 [Mannheimia varigena USDA-ARS-USMARC-1388]|uniref:Uncharacterized protein n=1 Tax=Mannheimia varigena USDA-ARS-USMARC-1296 TaxID=1433287 RepID=W0QCF4_9PAST|nr:hypothetical protein X808_10080 [Mannheimia varigena USDA-ARS-USMARC-1296]AHG79753.1 hypothetical protein X875_11340 [Mannheimia varigena USDA-ARS-USMARC-1388]